MINFHDFTDEAGQDCVADYYKIAQRPPKETLWKSKTVAVKIINGVVQVSPAEALFLTHPGKDFRAKEHKMSTITTSSLKIEQDIPNIVAFHVKTGNGVDRVDAEKAKNLRIRVIPVCVGESMGKLLIQYLVVNPMSIHPHLYFPR